MASAHQAGVGRHGSGKQGKHKVPILRNVDKGFGKEFPKAYGHKATLRA